MLTLTQHRTAWLVRPDIGRSVRSRPRSGTFDPPSRRAVDCPPRRAGRCRWPLLEL